MGRATVGRRFEAYDRRHDDGRSPTVRRRGQAVKTAEQMKERRCPEATVS